MNAYEKAIQLGLPGSAEQQFAALQSLGLTIHPIKLDELLFALNEWDMLTKTDGNGTAERWVGSIPAMKSVLVAAATLPENPTPEQQQAAATATAYVKAIDRWFSHVTNPRNVKWDTTMPEYAAPFAAMRAQFEHSGLFKLGAFDAIYALGGGLLATSLEVFAHDKSTYTQAEAARKAYRDLHDRRRSWDTLSAAIRSRIESGELADNAAVIAAVTSEIGS
jgi:hypothetical protein